MQKEKKRKGISSNQDLFLSIIIQCPLGRVLREPFKAHMLLWQRIFQCIVIPQLKLPF